MERERWVRLVVSIELLDKVDIHALKSRVFIILKFEESSEQTLRAYLVVLPLHQDLIVIELLSVVS